VLGWLHKTKKVGFHAFRRFRTEVLRRARVPEDLTRLWLGHSKESVTDYYTGGLKNDSAWRQEWSVRVARKVADDQTVSWEGNRWGVPREETCSARPAARFSFTQGHTSAVKTTAA
jgi:hypothetical protein